MEGWSGPDMGGKSYQAPIYQFSIGKTKSSTDPLSRVHNQPHTSLYSFLAGPLFAVSPLCKERSVLQIDEGDSSSDLAAACAQG